MNQSRLYHDLLEEATALVKQAAHGKRRTLSVSPEVAALLESVAEAPRPAPPVAHEPAVHLQAEHVDPELAAALDALRAEVAACEKCGLCKTRTQTVFSDGSANARLVFVGEAPGFDEDRTGVPFVGKAGQLLTDIITKGMNIRREDVYICNVLKCRPPENRDPLPSEKQECEPYLVRQLELIKPKVICALGRHAANTLLKTDESTGRLRGKWHSYHGIPLRVTYHPAYLLRNPADKKKTWDDIQHVMRVLDGDGFAATAEDVPESSQEQSDLFA